MVHIPFYTTHAKFASLNLCYELYNMLSGQSHACWRILMLYWLTQIRSWGFESYRPAKGYHNQYAITVIALSAQLQRNKRTIMQICSTGGYGGDGISGCKDGVPAFLKLVELPSLAAMVTLTKSAGLQKWERKCLFLPTERRGIDRADFEDERCRCISLAHF